MKLIKEKLKDYLESDRGKTKDFDDLVYNINYWAKGNEEEDNWNLADLDNRILLLQCPCGFIAFDIVEHNCDGRIVKSMDWKQIIVYRTEKFKTFIQKVREDDVKSEEKLRDSEHTEQYKKGYLDALDDTNQHRKNRAGDL